MSDLSGYYQAPSPIGFITITINENGVIISCNRGKHCEQVLQGYSKEWLDQYFSGKSQHYNGMVVLPGTQFQQSVWANLPAIPYGTTISYSEMATKIGSANAYRAVGSACGANPCPIFVPCHRIVAANGLGGFAWGLECKQFLLQLEKKYRN